MSQPTSIIAVDIGNSRVKLACYELPLPDSRDQKIVPQATCHVDQFDVADQQIPPFLAKHQDAQRCYISSVNQSRLQTILSIFEANAATFCCTVLSHEMLPIKIMTPQPEKVGLDRLMAAVAANRIHHDDRPVAIIDLGTAITIDWLSENGEFLGGVIAPGIKTAAIALHRQTDQLPLINVDNFTEPPKALGTTTQTAIQSGLFYGTIGAIKETISQFSNHFGQTPVTIVTGGAATLIALFLDGEVTFAPNLILDGIAISAETLQ